MASLPDEFALYPSSPNPFNPTTTIRYDLPKDSFVRLKIYDLLGREIRSLVNGNMDGGYRRVVWDGTDNSGKAVPSGIYIYRFDANSLETDDLFHETRKMLLLR